MEQKEGWAGWLVGVQAGRQTGKEGSECKEIEKDRKDFHTHKQTWCALALTPPQIIM